MSAIEHTDPSRVLAVDLTPACPASPSVTGYGRKIPTCYRVRYIGPDHVTRWHRVYAMVYGNAGSAYILSRGRVLFLDNDTEYDLEGLL